MTFSLIEAPLELGCGTRGCAGALEALTRLGLPDAVAPFGGEPRRIRAFPPVTGRRPGEPRPYYLSEVASACRAAADAVGRELRAGSFPVLVGGDHALGLGSAAASAVFRKPEALSLIWVDAHTDINTEDSSPSGNIHGMPVAALLGLCREPLAGIGGPGPKFLPENVHIVFARSIDAPEEDILRATGVRLYRMADIRKRGIAATVRLLLDAVRTPAVHLSFDVDAIGSGFFTATGLPVPDGPSPGEVAELMTAVARAKEVVALDCVEYDPTRDTDGGAGGRTVLSVLVPVLEAIRKRRETP